MSASPPPLDRRRTISSAAPTPQALAASVPAEHEACTKAAQALLAQLTASKAAAEKARVKFTTQRDQIDEKLAKMTTELRTANSAALAERVQCQKEAEVLRRSILTGQRKADQLAEQCAV